MKVARFYSEGELSAIRISNVDETIFEVKNLFAGEQVEEEKISSLIRQNNFGEQSEVDELRLDFDRIYSKKDILSKTRFGRYKFIDSCFYNSDFSIETILAVKSEQRYLSAKFNGYMVLRSRFGSSKKEAKPYLFASLKNGYFYLLNADEVSSSNIFISSFKKTFSWIQKKISFKTSSK